MHRVISVKPLDGYRLWVQFEDGVEGGVDLSDLVGKGVFAAWRDRAEFLKVSVSPETHTLTWPDGNDICPDSLYDDVTSLVARDKPRDT